MSENYSIIAAQLEALTDGVDFAVTNLANAASLLWHSLEDINWVGFYIANEGTLKLGPFMGKPACVRIPAGKGVCGTAAAENRTVTVPDVHKFPGHIACDSESLSEIVVPLRQDGRVAAVLDIDSPTLSRFSCEDAAGLEIIAAILERRCRF